MSMAKSVLISRGLSPEALTIIPKDVTTDLNGHERPLSPKDLLARLRGKQGLICQITDTIDDEVLSTPGLQVVSNIAVGYNNIDVAAAKRRGVIVTNTPDVLTETTADFAWALLMAAARRIVEADRYARSGEWKTWKWDLLWGADIHGKTIGILGFGRIGRAVARRALGFGMQVLYYDAMQSSPEVERELNATYVDKDRLLRDSDFVSLHVLLSAETRHVIDERALRSMKKTAVLVNAARGPIVDEAALVKALSEKWIAAAGLDVFEEEPTIHPGLLPLTNVVMAPHIASASLDTRVAMSTLAVKNCLAVLEGKAPLTPVT
jgi:glyoxylate reductase